MVVFAPRDPTHSAWLKRRQSRHRAGVSARQELVAAMRAGQVSVRTADSLFYLPLEEQRAQLERRLQAAEQRERRSKAVAATIHSYLDSGQRIDLGELQGRIRSALAAGV